MGASKVLRTSLVWLAALGIAFSVSPASLGAGEIEDVVFGFDRVPAAWGQAEVPLQFSMRNLPEGAQIRGFGFSFGFRTAHLTFRDARVLLDARSDLYVVDYARAADYSIVRIEVFFAQPAAIADGACVALTFIPELSYAEDIDKTSLMFPVTLIPGEETWISLEGSDPLVPVKNLQDGGIDLWGFDAVHFGSSSAPRGSVAVMPIMLTNVSALASLAVGVDYDEDMLGVLACEIAPEVQGGVTSLHATIAGGVLALDMTFGVNFTQTAAACRPIALVAFWVSADAAPGARIDLGPRTRAEGTVSDPWANPVTIPVKVAEGGAILVQDNPRRFLRGDVNGDGALDASDPVALLSFLFRKPSRSIAGCPDAADVNDDGGVDLADALALLSYAFRGGEPPRPPFPQAGIDPTLDPLTACERSD